MNTRRTKSAQQRQFLNLLKSFFLWNWAALHFGERKLPVAFRQFQSHGNGSFCTRGPLGAGFRLARLHTCGDPKRCPAEANA
jgi:hypothetical protein